jgi:hypothetical protein
MKKNYRFIALARSGIYLAPAIAALLLTLIFSASAHAQGNRRSGEKRNHKERYNQSPGANRQNDIAVGRPDRGDWKRNNGNDYKRNRNYDAGNMNRDDNNGWKKNKRNDNDITMNRSGNNDGYGRRSDNGNRGGYDFDNRGRRDDDDDVRRGNHYRRNMYTRDRPGYRPVYQYDRRPVYNRYDPCWRYNYLPRRNSYFYHMPSNYISINFGGFGYRYWDGVFYRPFNNLFTVCAPPVGIYINILPAGYRRIYVRNYPYYYYNGTFYDQRGSNYYVVSPPLGAIVESIPDGYETVVIDGETYYVVDGAQYKPVVIENGEIWYEVIKAN